MKTTTIIAGLTVAVSLSAAAPTAVEGRGVQVTDHVAVQGPISQEVMVNNYAIFLNGTCDPASARASTGENICVALEQELGAYRQGMKLPNNEDPEKALRGVRQKIYTLAQVSVEKEGSTHLLTASVQGQLARAGLLLGLGEAGTMKGTERISGVAKQVQENIAESGLTIVDFADPQ